MAGGETEYKAYISDRLGFIRGEFSLDRVELCSSLIGYSGTLVPHFQRVDGSGRIISSYVNPSGNLVLILPANRWFAEATSTMNTSSGVTVIGSAAVSGIARIETVSLAGSGLFQVELRGNIPGWIAGESYRLMFGYSQTDGRPFTRWWDAICDVMQVIYNPGSDSTSIVVSGLGIEAGQGTAFPINSSHLNGRTISVAGSLTSQFTIEDAFLQVGGSILNVDGNATHVIESGSMISIGAREDAYQAHANTGGSYIFNGDILVFDNINRQYSLISGIWDSVDLRGTSGTGSYYLYCDNNSLSYKDSFGLEKIYLSRKAVDDFSLSKFRVADSQAQPEGGFIKGEAAAIKSGIEVNSGNYDKYIYEFDNDSDICKLYDEPCNECERCVWCSFRDPGIELKAYWDPEESFVESSSIRSNPPRQLCAHELGHFLQNEKKARRNQALLRDWTELAHLCVSAGTSYDKAKEDCLKKAMNQLNEFANDMNLRSILKGIAEYDFTTNKGRSPKQVSELNKLRQQLGFEAEYPWTMIHRK